MESGYLSAVGPAKEGGNNDKNASSAAAVAYERRREGGREGERGREGGREEKEPANIDLHAASWRMGGCGEERGRAEAVPEVPGVGCLALEEDVVVVVREMPRRSVSPPPRGARS